MYQCKLMAPAILVEVPVAAEEGPVVAAQRLAIAEMVQDDVQKPMAHVAPPPTPLPLLVGVKELE